MIREIENELFIDCSNVVRDAMKFSDIEIDEKTGDVLSYPESWGKDLNQGDLQRRLRIAKANWMTSSEVPNGIKMAQQIALGVMSSRSKENIEKPVLRIQNAIITAPVTNTVFGEIEVDE